MSYLGVEKDEQSSIKVIQRQFEYLNTTLEAMNECLARNETSDIHRNRIASQANLGSFGR